MSDPTAVTGEVPTTRIRSGVISEPPPMPVIPTMRPTPRPKMIRSGSMLAVGSSGGRCRLLVLHRRDQDVRDLGPRELLRRALAVAEHLSHLGAGEEHAVLRPGGARLRGGHALRDLAVEGVLQHQPLYLQLVR